MKGLYLFCTRLRFYWVEIPLFLLLTITLLYNDESKALLKLYPLIIITIAAMIFVLVYFFRVIHLSYDEIRYIGLFSSRDRAIITKGKTVIITMLGQRRLRVVLFGNDGVLPDLDWLKNSDSKPKDIELFKGKVVGSTARIKTILSYFGADREDLEDILKCDNFEKKYRYVTVSSSITDECKQIKIRMDETV